MNALGITLLWCAVQVTVLAVLAVGSYVVAGRRRPARAASLLTAGILAVLAVSGLALSPWPNWVTFSGGRPASDHVTSEPRAPASGQGAAPSKVLHPTLARSNGVVDGATFDRDRTAEQLFGWSESFAAALRGELDRTRTSDSVSHWRWPATLAALAVVGALLMLLRLGFGLWLVHRYRKGSTPLDGTEIDAMLAHLGSAMGLRRRVVLRESAAIATPATLGWLRPTILLPPAWSDWSDDERRAVLSHELAHVEADDYLTGIVAEFARALHFYNPLVRWIASQLRLEQELAADATAALSVGSKERYLESLARLAIKNDDPPVALLVRPFLPRRGTLLRRIDRLRSTRTWITQPTPRKSGRTLLGLTVAILTLAVAGVRLPAVDGDDTVIAATQEPEASQQFDLRYVPVDAGGIMIARPADLFNNPLFQEARKAAPVAEWGELEKLDFLGIRPEDIQEIIGVLSNEGAGPGYILRGSKPISQKGVIESLKGKVASFRLSGPTVLQIRWPATTLRFLPRRKDGLICTGEPTQEDD